MINIPESVEKATPEVIFDEESKTLSFKGKSFPENSDKFYNSIFDDLKEILNKEEELTVILYLSYINSSSSHEIYELLSILDQYKKQGKTISVKWEYLGENESMEEQGEDFQEDFEDLKIQLVVIDE